MSPFYHVYLKRPGTGGRATRVREQPTDWATAVADYRRPRRETFTVTMFEVTEDGRRIRRISRMEIKNNEPEGPQA